MSQELQMRKIFRFCLLILLLAAIPVYAGETREIELTDGSVITGEVQSLTGGTYTIKSDSLGTIKLEESKVRAIRSKAPANSGVLKDSAAGSGSEVRTLQEKMTSDKEIMSMIQSLRNDPDFKKILEDPEIMKAVQAGDVPALMANPRFMKLMNNATVKEIEKKVE
jgi:hypothetical protein